MTKVRPRQSKPRKPVSARTPRDLREGMTDAQREIHVKKALTRFVRNRQMPEDLEDLRYNLIQARVMSGMLEIEAAEKFGYSNSTQINLIESGARKVPNDHKFIKQAAQVYSVSIDWLLGLSPHMEPDRQVGHQYALKNGVEAMLGGLASQMTTAIIAAADMKPTEEELMSIVSASQNLIERFERIAPAFEDVPGGAPVVAAIERIRTAVIPLGTKLKKIQNVDNYMRDVIEGRISAVPHLTERYCQRELGL